MLYLVYNVFNLSNHTILLTFEGSIIDNYFFTPNYQMEQFGPNFFVCPQVGVEPTSQTYFVWFYRWATEGCFLFGSLDDISITHSFIKVNRLMIFFSLARRVGFEPTDGFPPPVFKAGAFDHSAISAYYWPNRKDSSYGSLTSPLPYHLANLVYLIGASVRWKHLYLRSCAEAPPTTGYVTFFVP